jgi:hypothetical protein
MLLPQKYQRKPNTWPGFNAGARDGAAGRTFRHDDEVTVQRLVKAETAWQSPGELERSHELA